LLSTCAMKPKLLIVDDNEGIRTQMKWALSREYDVFLAGDREAALARFKEQHPSVVLLDLGLPPQSRGAEEGLAALSEMLREDNLAKIIIVSGQADRHNAMQAVGVGAFDFLAKPVHLDELRVILKRAFQIANLQRDYRELRSRMGSDDLNTLLGAESREQPLGAPAPKARRPQ